jgi:hypothetical protein
MILVKEGVVGMKLSRKNARVRVPSILAAKEPQGEAWPAKAGPWALTPSALIPFGSYMPSPRASRRTDGGDGRR